MFVSEAMTRSLVNFYTPERQPQMNAVREFSLPLRIEVEKVSDVASKGMSSSKPHDFVSRKSLSLLVPPSSSISGIRQLELDTTEVLNSDSSVSESSPDSDASRAQSSPDEVEGKMRFAGGLARLEKRSLSGDLARLEPFSGARERTLAKDLAEIEKTYATVGDSLKGVFKELAELIDRDPAFAAYKGIASQNLYKLFIDANRWPENMKDKKPEGHPALCFDKREPGFMEAMVRTFIWMMQYKGPRDASFIEQLHDSAVGNVFDKSEQTTVKFTTGYRKAELPYGECFHVVLGETLTPAGFKEMVKKRKDPAYALPKVRNIFEAAMLHPNETISINPLKELPAAPSFESLKKEAPRLNWKINAYQKPHEATAEEMMKVAIAKFEALGSAYKAFQEGSGKEGGKHPKTLLKEAVGATKDAYNNLKKDFNLRLNSEDSNLDKQVRKCIKQIEEFQAKLSDFDKAISPCIKLAPPKDNDFLPACVNHFLKMYEDADKGSDHLALKASARLPQDLDDLHPFYDGNIRSFGILYLQKLLVENGQSPTCLYDPNCLDCLSNDEIVERIKDGQKRFQSLKVS